MRSESSLTSLSVDSFDIGVAGAVIAGAAGLLVVYFEVTQGTMIPILGLSLWVTLAGTWYFSNLVCRHYVWGPYRKLSTPTEIGGPILKSILVRVKDDIGLYVRSESRVPEVVRKRVEWILDGQLSIRRFGQRAHWYLGAFGVIAAMMAVIALAAELQTTPDLLFVDLFLIVLVVALVAWRFEGKRTGTNPRQWGETVSDLWDLATEERIRDYLCIWAEEKIRVSYLPASPRRSFWLRRK